MSGDNEFYGGLLQGIPSVPPPLFHIGVAFPIVDFTSCGIGHWYWMFRKALEDLFSYTQKLVNFFP
jgi:hypothetical protein